MSEMAPSPSPFAAREISADQGVELLHHRVAARRDRRGRVRVQCEGLSSTLGRVIGLSCTGMRVQGRGRCRILQEDRVSITLKHCGGSLTLPARVAWVRKTGLFRYESGMEFLNLTPTQQVELGQIARTTMPRLLIRKGTLTDVPAE